MHLSLETLTSIVRTGVAILLELIDLVNFVLIFFISNGLTQMVWFPTWIPDCDSHSPGLLDLFLSSDASISSTMAFPPLGNSDHVVFSVSIRVSIIFRTGCPISLHCLWLFWCYCDGLCDHLRDVL